ncbi:MAG: hypothetical protein KF847_10630 [Pirellulales bacterium]|nr:hypothetical protein [Pirellulales bacterium]
MMRSCRRSSRSVPNRLPGGVGFVLSWLIFGTPLASAAVTTVGAVPNAPPVGGGAVVGAFTIGESAFGSVTVTAGTAITSNGGATIGNNLAGVGVVSLTGFGSNWTITGSNSDLTLGDEGVGTVSVANQAVLIVPDDTIVGAQSTSSGKLTVSGLGSVYSNGDDFTLGNAGLGIVEITNGGGVTSDVVVMGDATTGRGRATITGDHSRWTATLTNIGDAGQGLLSILDGGRYVAQGDTNVGILTGSYGLIDVAGVGSLYSHGGPNFILGNVGTGEIIVRDGGLITSASTITIAATSASVGSVTVDGAGSRIKVTGNLTTGTGDGTILISNGGVVSTTTSSAVSATGRLTMAGGRFESTAASSAAINVFGLVQGSGVIDVQGVTTSSGTPRGRLQTSAGDHLLLTGTLTNGGVVDLAGGELEIRGLTTNNNDIDARNGATLRFGGAGLDNNSGSQLAITGGSVDVFGLVDNNAGAEIAVVGGATAVFHDVVTNSGTIFVSPGSEIVMLENLGFVPSSTLAVQLAPTTDLADPTDAHGLVSVGGTATLGGTLAVSLAGYVPKSGDVFPILRASQGVSGAFAVESLPTLGGGFAFDVQYTSDAVLLAVTGGGFLEADFNQDGFVDGADLSIWKGAYGATAQGDATGDAATDGADFLVWQRQFGAAPAVASSTAGATNVPEPATLLLALVASCGLGVGASRARRETMPAR